MKVSLRQVLIGFVVLAGVFGIGSAIQDGRWSDVTVFGFLLSAAILIYVSLLDSTVEKTHWAVARSPGRQLALLAVVLGALAALIWSLFLGS